MYGTRGRWVDVAFAFAFRSGLKSFDAVSDEMYHVVIDEQFWLSSENDLNNEKPCDPCETIFKFPESPYFQSWQLFTFGACVWLENL